MSVIAKWREYRGTQIKPDYAKQVEELNKQENIQNLNARKTQEQARLNALPVPIASKPILSTVLPTLNAQPKVYGELPKLTMPSSFSDFTLAPINAMSEQDKTDRRNKTAKEMISSYVGEEEPKGLTEWEKTKVNLPGQVFYENLTDAFTFGATGTNQSKAYKDAFKEKEKENKVQAITGNVLGSIGGQGILYKAVNKALAGAKIGSVALQGGVKGFAASQGVQLVADAIVQTPIEIIRAIEDDKDIDDFGKDWLINRGIDAVMNSVMGGLEIGIPKLKQLLTSNRVKKAIADKGIPVDDLVKAVDSGDSERVTFYVNQYGVADTKPFDQFQLPAPSKSLDDFTQWRKDNFGGAYGKMSDADETALRQLYKEDTGININPRQIERPFTVTPNEVPLSQRVKLQNFNPNVVKQADELAPRSAALMAEEPSITMRPVEPTLKTETKQPLDAKINFRKTLTNSFQKSQLDDVSKTYFDANPREYEIYTNANSWDKAYDKVNSNFNSAIKDFDSKSALNTADDTAEGIAIMHKLSNDGNIDELIKVADAFAERATSAGQAIQAIVMLQKTTPEGKLVQGFNMMKSAVKKIEEETPDLYRKLKEQGKLPELSKEDAEFIVKTMKEAQELTGRAKVEAIGKVDQLLADKIPATFGDKVRALRNLSLLGNFKTIGTRNPLGNVIFAGLENLSQIPSGLTDKIVSAALKTNITTSVLPDLGAQFGGLKTGVKDALSDIKLGIDTSPVRGGAELPRSRKVFEIALLNKANNWLGNALKLGDRPFYQAGYEARLKELKKFNPTMNEKELEELAMSFGKDRTFQNDGATSKAFKKVKDALNTANIKGFGLGDVIMPYTQTPANILAKGVQYTPLNILQIAKIASGGGENIARNQKAFVDAVGRTFTGAGITALGYVLAKNGYISGKNQDTSNKVKNLRKDLGQQQYSIKIGDTWYSYDWAQPASIPLAVGVDFFNAGASEKDLQTALEKGLISGGETLLQQGLLQGIMRMFGGYSPIENLIETVGTSPTQFLPTLGNQTAQFKDEFKRDVDYKSSTGKQLLDLSKRRIPGLRETLPATLNLWGEPVKEQQGRTGIEKAFDIFANPSLKSKETDDPIIKEVYKVFNESKETGVIPSYTPAVLRTTDDIRNFKMIYGQLAKQELTTLFANPSYKESKEKHKIIKKLLNDLQDTAKTLYNNKYNTQLK